MYNYFVNIVRENDYNYNISNNVREKNMDRVRDYVEKINIKSAVVGGFDKESVYLCLKELVTIFEEELDKSQKECLDLQKKIQDMSQTSAVQQNTHTEIFNEINRLKKYVNAYQETKKELDQVSREKFHLTTVNKKMKEEYQQEILQLKQQISSQSNDKDLLSLDYIKKNLNQTIDQLSQSFIQQNEDILLENKQLKEENESLKILIEKSQKTQEQDQQHFVEEINQLYNTLETLKNRYIKEEE